MKKKSFKVIPGLSISGKEITQRVQNRSIVLGGNNNQYSTEPEMARLRKMDRSQLHREYLRGKEQIESLHTQLRNLAERARTSQLPQNPANV